MFTCVINKDNKIDPYYESFVSNFHPSLLIEVQFFNDANNGLCLNDFLTIV